MVIVIQLPFPGWNSDSPQDSQSLALGYHPVAQRAQEDL